MKYPEHYGFTPNDTVQFSENGSYLGIGAAKSVRLIEGPRVSSRNMGIIIETKKTPFHYNELVYEKISRMVRDPSRMINGDIDRISRILQGIFI